MADMADTATTPTSLYPEHDKLAKIADKSQAIGEFLEWAEGHGTYLLHIDEDDNYLTVRTQRLLAEFFEIDQAKIDAEKDAMLAAMREANGG